MTQSPILITKAPILATEVSSSFHTKNVNYCQGVDPIANFIQPLQQLSWV